jgi:hypothetical protein
MRSIRKTLPSRAGRPTRLRVRVTKPGRRLNDRERREIEARLRAEGRLQSQDRRI